MKKIMTKQDSRKDRIIIYKTSDNGVELDVQFDGDSVWLSQDQIAKLFGKDRTVITRHISNIFRDKEVDQKSNVQKMHIPNSDKPVKFYGLDIILAVGYRTSSGNAIKFRKWATHILKKYLLDGYAINENRIKEAQDKFFELQNAITFLAKKTQKNVLSGQEAEILNLIYTYSKSLTFLEQYDKNSLSHPKGRKAKYVLEYDEATYVISEVKRALIKKNEATDIFGQERKGAFEGIIGSIYQTFKGVDLYLCIEEKAAHLLYFVIKDHPFTDGNKRSASFLFVYFLEKNGYLYNKSGERKINDTALTALALLVAESDPDEKDIMINLIINLIA